MKELNNCYQMEELNEPYTIFVISFISVRVISLISKEKDLSGCLSVQHSFKKEMGAYGFCF